MSVQAVPDLRMIGCQVAEGVRGIDELGVRKEHFAGFSVATEP